MKELVLPLKFLNTGIHYFHKKSETKSLHWHKSEWFCKAYVSLNTWKIRKKHDTHVQTRYVNIVEAIHCFYQGNKTPIDVIGLHDFYSSQLFEIKVYN